MSDDRRKPKVSVCVITYNHAAYIAECLQSLVDQKASFDFEIIVGEDCSTDETRAIVEAYARKYPDRIRPILHERNVGIVENYFRVHEEAAGDYVAHLDGDDYALPGKLQAQADFLDANPDCQIVWHRMHTLSEKENLLFEDNFHEIGMTSTRMGIDHLLMNITIGLHSSKMYRNPRAALDRVDLVALDFSENIMLLRARDGDARFLGDGIYGVYRTGVGVSQNPSKIRRLIYDWLGYFHGHGIGNRSLINAKIFWMLLTDLRHGYRSFRHGFGMFLRTLPDFSPLAILRVRRSSFPASIRHRPIGPWRTT